MRFLSFSFDSSLFDLMPDDDVAESPLSRSRRSLFPVLKSVGMLNGSGSTLENQGLVRMRHRCRGLGAVGDEKGLMKFPSNYQPEIAFTSKLRGHDNVFAQHWAHAGVRQRITIALDTCCRRLPSRRIDGLILRSSCRCRAPAKVERLGALVDELLLEECNKTLKIAHYIIVHVATWRKLNRVVLYFPEEPDDGNLPIYF